MSFWWEITSLVQLGLKHSLKWMQYHPKLVDVDEDEDMVVIMEGIVDTMVLMIVIPQTPREKKISLHHQKWSNTEVKQKIGKYI